MNFTWPCVFRGALERTAHGHVKELQDVRNAWAHRRPFSEGETNRALDTAIRFLRAIGANDQAEKVEQVLAPASSPKLINARDRKDAPLHRAAGPRGDPAVVAALMAGGADLEARDEDGRLPVDRAKDNEALQGTDAYWRLNEARLKE